jgi:hypothetical protein
MAAPAIMSAGSDLAPSDLDDDDKTLLGAPLNWPQDRVKAFHKIIYEATMTTMIVPQCLPHSLIPPKTSAVPLNLTQSIQLDAAVGAAQAISSVTSDPGLSHRVIELWVNVACLDEQIKEAGEAATPESTSMAVIVRKAAQQHALAWDSVFVNGYNAYSSQPFAQNVGFHQLQQTTDGGLLGLTLTANGNIPYTIFTGPPGISAAPNPYQYLTTPLIVPPLSSTQTQGVPGLVWGVNSLPQCAAMIAQMTANFNPGPYALIVTPTVYAEFFAPAGPDSLAITHDRLLPQFKVGIFPSNALPSVTATAGSPGYESGVIVSAGGGAVSVLVGQLAKLRHMQRDPTGYHRFRITGRNVLQISDLNAVGQLLWQVPPTG